MAPVCGHPGAIRAESRHGNDEEMGTHETPDPFPHAEIPVAHHAFDLPAGGMGNSPAHQPVAGWSEGDVRHESAVTDQCLELAQIIRVVETYSLEAAEGP